MLLALISALLIMGVGLAAARGLGAAGGSRAVGLAPGAGLALLAAIGTWAFALRLAPPVVGILMVTTAVAGVAGMAKVAVSVREYDRASLGMLAVGSVIPLFVLASAVFVQFGVPDYMHDGAHHAEMIEALRNDRRIAGLEWYPAGFHTPIAALLSLVPGIDSAMGAVGWSVALSVLAPVAIFGLGLGLWCDARVAAAGALSLALTYHYPYEPHLFSVWPMAAGLLVVIALWTLALDFIERPRWHIGVLGGLLAGALLLIHGTELITAALGLVVLAATHWRALASRRAVGGLVLALGVAAITVAPYVPALASWTAGGGAASVGEAAFPDRHGVALEDIGTEVLFWSSGVSSGLLGDLPVRLALLGIGVWVALRERRAELIALSVIFGVLVAVLRYVDARPVQALYALTLPWGVDDRLLMTLPLLTAPLAGMGLVRLGSTLSDRSRRHGDVSGDAAGGRWRRTARMLLALGLAMGGLALVLITLKFSFQTGRLVTYSADDAAAMAWLRQTAPPGAVLMNDGTSDAGIWAPFKAGVAIVLPRTAAVRTDGLEALVRAHVGELEAWPEARAAACQLRITYVYRGSAASPADARTFPSVEVLRTSAALEEVFARGAAAVFRTRLDCASP